MAVQSIPVNQVPIKTYVLLDTLNVDSPVFQVLGDGTRDQILKLPRHRPYMQVPLQTKEGEAKTLRFKEYTNHIWLKDQLEIDKIDANAKFSQKEYDLLWFKNGVLTTNRKNVQDFLENHPEYLGFEGFCDHVKAPCYKLLDKKTEGKLRSRETKKRIEAGVKIYAQDLVGIQEMLMRINGKHYTPPIDIEDCQNLMIDFMEQANDEGLEAILKEDVTIDEKVLILISKLINTDSLVFEDNGDVRRKLKTGEFMSVRKISGEYDLDQRIGYFADFLNTEDGKLLKDELEGDLKFQEKPESKKDSKPK